MILVGTCHFTGWRAATNYYRAMGFADFLSEAHTLVKEKRKAGEIFYGPPERKTGQRARIDRDGRYLIEVPE
jgi:hypothetical protein